MPHKEALEAARSAVEAQRDGLVGLGRFLHAHPELGFEEHRAAERIAGFLGELGFEVEKPYAGLATSFRAALAGPAGEGPVVAVLAEYDALKGIGHACGHNLITVAALAAATGMAGCGQSWPGRFEVIGTPAEELLGGKCTMVEAGAFDHLDACFMTHPSNESKLCAGSNAMKSVTVTFRGRAAHAAAAPEEGINALDAALLFFSALNALRQHLPEDGRLHGIITRGGEALNVIPELAEVRVGVRSADESYLDELSGRVEAAARSAAGAIGAEVELQWDRNWYRALRINGPLDGVLAQAFEAAGIRLAETAGSGGRGSLDMGNVSQVVPASHPFFNILPEGEKVALHSRQFLERANAPRAYSEALKAGTAMALAARRLLAEGELLEGVRRHFKQAGLEGQEGAAQ